MGDSETLDQRLNRRPLPTLKQWLAEKNGDERMPGFDDFAALVDLGQRTLLHKDSGLPANEACFLRLWQGFLIATVELCGIEQKNGVPIDLIVGSSARAMACASIYVVASVTGDDAPLRDIAKMLTEDFRFAAKQAADDILDRSVRMS